ncbi:Alpha/Beta hydrolase protein [Hypoxylon sp. FL1284]|nr:Alpha/Beta hydrolase protein [Hypoxylon sp. FL1284]
MAATNNPLARPPGSDPEVSSVTLTIAGLKVDVYGLSELPAAASKVSCLWLHHPRLRVKEDMAGIAGQILSAYHQQGSSFRGLIAVAFDQRNHGSRLVDGLANEAWRDGNKTHAQDMLGTISGAVTDTIHLLDVLESYLFGAGDGPGARPDGGQRHIDHNMVLGVSLGGHSAWQLLFADPRVTAGVMVIGCPDYMYLLGDRARLSKLKTFTTQDEGAPFFGSKDFPEILIEACKKYDPKGILFGTGDISEPPSTAADQERLRPILDSRIARKRFQVLSGGADKLVPYRASEAFMNFLKESVATWYKDGGSYVEDNVYPGIGHEFSTSMRNDAVRFVLDSVTLADGNKEVTPKM